MTILHAIGGSWRHHAWVMRELYCLRRRQSLARHRPDVGSTSRLWHRLCAVQGRTARTGAAATQADYQTTDRYRAAYKDSGIHAACMTDTRVVHASSVCQKPEAHALRYTSAPRRRDMRVGGRSSGLRSLAKPSFSVDARGGGASDVSPPLPTVFAGFTFCPGVSVKYVARRPYIASGLLELPCVPGAPATLLVALC